MTLSCDHCLSDAAVLAPGDDEERSAPGGILIRAGKPDRRWCLPCAMRAGWPWLKSEDLRPENDHRQFALFGEGRDA